MGWKEFFSGKKKKDSQKTEQQDAIELDDIASRIFELEAMGNQGGIDAIDFDKLSSFGDEQEPVMTNPPESRPLFQEHGNQGEIDSKEFMEQMSVIEDEDDDEDSDGSLFGAEDDEEQEGESKVLSEEVPKKEGASDEWTHIDAPTSAIQYEQVPDKVRKTLTDKKTGELRALLADKSPADGIGAIREKYRLTADEMKKPDAVPRMTEPYFRAAISELSKDQTLSEEQQKALSDFSEEMDQQMMINAMKAPGKEQIANLERAFRGDEEKEQTDREFKAKGMQKAILGKAGIISYLKSGYLPSGKPGDAEVAEKMREEQTRQKESARSLLKVFLMMQIGNMQKRETDQETGRETDTDWDHNMSDLFAHGSRIVIETGDQSADPKKRDSVWDVMTSMFSPLSGFEPRDAATHYIAEGEMGELREKKGNGAAIKGILDRKWKNYGMPVAIGGSGSKGPVMLDEEAREKNRIIRTDNRNGHLYVGKKEGSEKQHGGFLIGLESDSPYRMNQWGHIHTAGAVTERIKSTGGMTKDLHGDQISGRNLFLGGMKNEDLIRIMRDVDKGFEELYDSKDVKKQQEYDEILRQLTGKRLEAEAVEEILKKLTKKDELGISVGKIREESTASKPILPKEMMEESVEEPKLEDDEKMRRAERDETLKKLLPDDPTKWQRFEVEESSEKEPAGPRDDDMVHRFLAAQGKTLEGELGKAGERAKKKEEEKKKHGDPYADVPLDAGPLFYEDDKSPEAKKEYEEANRLAAEKLKKAKGGDQVYDPEKVGQEWLYDRDENGRYYSAQVSSDPTHFGKHHKLDTSAYLILADQVIRVDDYIAGRSTSAEEKAVTETKPEPGKDMSGETALVPAGSKFTEFSEAMQKNCMIGIENLRKFMEQYAPEEEKEAYQKLFKSIGLYEKALSTGQAVEPELFFRSIPSESITFRGSYDLRKLVEIGITDDQLQAVHKFLEITDTENPAVLRLNEGIAAVQKALAGEAGGLKRLPAPGKEQKKKPEETGGLKLITDNPFNKKPEEKTEEPPKEETAEPKKSTSMFDFFNLRDSQKKEKKEEPKPEEPEKKEEPKDIGTDIDLEKQITGASCYAYVAAALLRHFGKKYGVQGAESVKEEDFPKAYGVERIWDGRNYERGATGKDSYKGYNVVIKNDKGLVKDFPDVAKKIGCGWAQDMNDIVEAIHQMSGGKAALNSKVYLKSEDPNKVVSDETNQKNMEGLKKTLIHVLNERKMPVGLLRSSGDTGHYVLVVGADEVGYSYKDPLNPDKLQKESWDSLKAYGQVSIKFLQHMDEITKDSRGSYKPMTGNGDEGEIERALMFPNDREKHLEHVDAYAYDHGPYSWQSIQPKKKKK